MEKRSYQEKAIQSVYDYLQKGINYQALILATGTGKTIIFGFLANELIQKTHKKVLILAHREELLYQAKEKILRINPKLRIGIEKAQFSIDPKDFDIILASVPTIGRQASKRLQKLDPNQFCMLVIDETHHVTADTYLRVLRHFGLLKSEPENNWNKECLLLGVTATPSRADNKGLDKIFNEVAYKYDILNGIEDKFLSRIKAYRVLTDTDLSNLHTVAGDFNQGELAEVINTDDRNGLIVKAYKTLTPDKQALCFAVDVAHAVEITTRFQENGIKAEYVIGITDSKDRINRLVKFKKKELQVLVSVGVLTEGYDEESIEVILMARPTQSGILFQQCIGRGTRIFPGKESLTVIDFVDNTNRHKLQSTASLLGIPGTFDFKGHDIFEVKEKTDKLLELAPTIEWEKLDIDKIDYTIEEVDILSGLKVPDIIATYTNYDWHPFGQDSYRLSLANGHHIQVSYDLVGKYIVMDKYWDSLQKKRMSDLIGKSSNLENAIRGADVYLTRKYRDQVILVKENARWRKDKITDKQKNLLLKFGVNQFAIEQLQKGDAARLITRLINRPRSYA